MNFFDYEIDDNHLYCFCLLNKKETYQRSWIPKQFAVLGKTIKLWNPNMNDWDNGWKVMQVSSKVMRGDDIDSNLEANYRIVNRWQKDSKLHRQIYSNVSSRPNRRKNGHH